MLNHCIYFFSEILYLGSIASILIILILVVKKIFSKLLSPGWHYYIWVLLLIRLMVPFSPESSLSIFNLVYIIPNSADLLAEGINTPILSDSGNGNTATEQVLPQTPAVSDSTGGDGGQVTDSGSKQPAKPISVIMILALIWLTGVVVLGFYTICANIVFAAGANRNYRMLTDTRVNGILTDCKRIMGIKGSLSLYTTELSRAPSLYIFRQAKILVSEMYLKQLNDQEIKYILLHELSHYKRKDIAVNWILTVLQIIYFFNPVIWYAIYKIHEDCEVSCDAEALRYLGKEEHQSYGNTIIKLIRLFSESDFIPVTAGIWKHKSNYKRRIIMINRFKNGKWMGTFLTVILIFAVGMIGLTGCRKAFRETNGKTAAELSASADDTKEDITPTVTATPTPADTKVPGDDGSDEASGTESGEVTDTDSDQDNSTSQPVLSESGVPRPVSDKGVSGAKPSQGDAGTKRPLAVSEPSPVAASGGMEGFLGDWTINLVSAYGAAGTYGREDAESLIGKTMSFSADRASCFGDQASDIEKMAKNPAYSITNISAENFLSDYRMTFDSLGITTDSVVQVSAADSEGNGCTFLIKDKDTLIVYGGGTFFELVRKN